MKNDFKFYQESIPFDARVTDGNGRVFLADCKIVLPSVWGESSTITLAVPSSELLTDHVANPLKIEGFLDSNECGIVIEELWYSSIVCEGAARLTGRSEIYINHVVSLSFLQSFNFSYNKLYVYITEADFFDELSTPSIQESFLDELACFECPKLGTVKLQRYYAKSRLKGSNSFLTKSGCRLEISHKGNMLDCELELSYLSPILNILSIFCRQRILVHGWEILGDKLGWHRFWYNPIDPLSTGYVSVEPKSFLISSTSFETQLNKAINNYHEIDFVFKKIIKKLSYNLSPAIKLRYEERFMSLFRGLESAAVKVKGKKELSKEDEVLIESLQAVVDSFGDNNPQVRERIKGFIKIVSSEKLSIGGKLVNLFKSKNIILNDLWNIEGENGLVMIRNKLAHSGAFLIHHQGLAVATYHLSIMAERYIFSLLELSHDESVQRQFDEEEWLHYDYIELVKRDVFSVDQEPL